MSNNRLRVSSNAAAAKTTSDTKSTSRVRNMPGISQADFYRSRKIEEEARTLAENGRIDVALKIIDDNRELINKSSYIYPKNQADILKRQIIEDAALDLSDNDNINGATKLIDNYRDVINSVRDPYSLYEDSETIKKKIVERYHKRIAYKTTIEADKMFRQGRPVEAYAILEKNAKVLIEVFGSKIPDEIKRSISEFVSQGIFFRDISGENEREKRLSQREEIQQRVFAKVKELLIEGKVDEAKSVLHSNEQYLDFPAEYIDKYLDETKKDLKKN